MTQPPAPQPPLYHIAALASAPAPAPTSPPSLSLNAALASAPAPAPARAATSPPPLFLILRASSSPAPRPREALFLIALLLVLALGPRTADAQCTGSTYSYGSGACAPCAPGTSFVSSALGCAPGRGPADTAFFLSGAQAEGVSAFALTGAAPTFAADHRFAAASAVTFPSGSYLTAPGASAPPALPAGGSVAWSAAAWVSCAPSNLAAVLEWGAPGGSGAGASPQTLALNVGGLAPAPLQGTVSTLAGSGNEMTFDGTGASASFAYPYGVAVIPSSGAVIVGQYGNNVIRLVTPLGATSILAGDFQEGFQDGTGMSAKFYQPLGVAMIPSSGYIAVADSKNNGIRLVTFPDAVVTTLAGSGIQAFADGAGTAASFNYPNGIAVMPSSSSLVVADTNNHRIRIVSYPGGVATTLAGGSTGGLTDGTGAAAKFLGPTGVAVMPSGSAIVVVDQGNNCIRLVTLLRHRVAYRGAENNVFSGFISLENPGSTCHPLNKLLPLGRSNVFRFGNLFHHNTRLSLNCLLSDDLRGVASSSDNPLLFRLFGTSFW